MLGARFRSTSKTLKHRSKSTKSKHLTRKHSRSHHYRSKSRRSKSRRHRSKSKRQSRSTKSKHRVGSVSKPKGSSLKKPKDMTKPKVSSLKKPKDMTKPKVSSLKKPKDTTTKPKDTTTKPKDTTTKPKDTTTKPKDTTTKPKDKSTAKEPKRRLTPFLILGKGSDPRLIPVSIMDVEGHTYLLGPKGATPKALKRRLVKGAGVARVTIGAAKVQPGGLVLVPDSVKNLDGSQWSKLPPSVPVMRLSNYIHTLGL